MPLILDHISQIYNADTEHPVKALDDVSLVIPEGQFIGVIGHTGSGKSTLMQHLNGLMKPTSGKIFFSGQDISDKDFNRKELRKHVGLVFQYPEHQLFETDVFADVCFGPRNMGMSKKDVIQMLINEQIFSSGISIVIGTVIGMVSSQLFVPLVQIFYATTDQTIPLEVINEKLDLVRLFSVIGIVIIICMIVLGKLISKINISQALKLGED